MQALIMRALSFRAERGDVCQVNKHHFLSFTKKFKNMNDSGFLA